MNLPPTTEGKIEAARLRLGAIGVALLYAAIVGLWIWLSDALLARLLPDPAQFAIWQTYKGWIFVAFTALLLWSERAWSDRRGQAAETEFRAVNDRLSAILKASPSGIIALDTQGLVQLWNPAAEQICGYLGREVLGKPVPDLQVPGDLD